MKQNEGKEGKLSRSPETNKTTTDDEMINAFDYLLSLQSVRSKVIDPTNINDDDAIRFTYLQKSVIVRRNLQETH